MVATTGHTDRSPAVVVPRRQPRTHGRLYRAAFALTLGVICAGAFGLRLFHLDQLSLWFDEGFTAYHVGLPLPDMLRELATLDHHPPLHYILGNLWALLAGTSEYSLRFISVAAGVATVAATGKLGQQMFGRATGLVAAALLAVAPLHVWYSQEARMYSLLAFFAVMALLCERLATDREAGLDVLSRRRIGVLWVAHCAFTVAALYTHYYGFFVVLAGFGLLLAGRPRESTITPWAIANGLAVVGFLPWVPFLLGQAADARGGFVPIVPPWESLPALIHAFAVGEHPWFAGAWLVTVALVALAATGALDAIARVPGRAATIGFLAIWVLVPPLVAFVATLLLGIDVRASGKMYYLFALPGFLILVARGVAALTLHQPVLAVIGASGLTLLAAPSLAGQFFIAVKEDFRSAGAYVTERAAPTDTLILNAESIYPVFDYYYRGRTPWQRASVTSPAATAAWLEQATRGSDRTWLVQSHDEVSDPGRLVVAWFERNATLLEQRWFDGVQIASYSMERRPNLTPPHVRLERRSNFGAGIQLIGYELSTFDPTRHFLPVKLYWHNLRQHATTYRIVVQLVDQRGTIWAQLDRPPIAGSYTTPRWQVDEYLTDRFDLPLPPGLPPLTYELRLFMYDQADGRRIPVTAEQGGPATSDVILTRLALGQLEGVPSAAMARSVDRLLNQRIGDFGTLVGGTFPRTPLDPGSRIDLALLWSIQRPPPPTQSLWLRIASPDARQTTDLPLFDQEDVFPPSRWTGGQLVRTHHRVTVPPELRAGDYQVAVVVKDTARPDRIQVNQVAVATVREPDRVFDAPPLAARLNLNFSNLVGLLGYDLTSAPVPRTQPAVLRLQWKCLAPMRESYVVFVHVLDQAGQIVAQADGVPGEAPRATTTWIRDEVIQDRRVINLGGLAPGTYRVAIGLYEPQTGARLPLAAGGPNAGADRVLLPQTLVVTD